MNSNMDNHTKANNLLMFVAWIILVIGIIGGLVIAFTKVQTGYYSREEYSALNMGIGFATMISSVLAFAACNWMARHLEYQHDQLYYLKEITDLKIKDMTNK